jgi:hypothetical protein
MVVRRISVSVDLDEGSSHTLPSPTQQILGFRLGQLDRSREVPHEDGRNVQSNRSCSCHVFLCPRECDGLIAAFWCRRNCHTSFIHTHTHNCHFPNEQRHRFSTLHLLGRPLDRAARSTTVSLLKGRLKGTKVRSGLLFCSDSF